MTPAQEITAAVSVLQVDPRYADLAGPLVDLLAMAARYAGPVEPPAPTWTGKAVRVARALLDQDGGDR